MKNSILVCIIVVLTLTSCIPIQPHSVCDELTTDSYLCSMADRLHVKLETIGDTLIVTNSLAISSGRYTNRDAKNVLVNLQRCLNTSITYVLFAEKIREYTNGAPALFNVVEKYLNEFALHQLLYQTDKDILFNWLQSQIDTLS